MVYIFVFLSLFFSIYSDELALVSTENDPSTLVEGVSMITGDLYVVEEDYGVQGAEPIPIRRSFLSRDGFFKNYQHLSATFLCLNNQLVVNEPNGTVVTYSADPNNSVFPSIGKHFYGQKTSKQKPLKYLAFLENDKGLANTKTGDISARTNLKNQTVVFDPVQDHKGKSFTLYAADGTQKRYRAQKGQDKIESRYGKTYIIYSYYLESETLPNGHMMHYQWDRENRLIRIYTTNIAQTKTFASLIIPTGNSKDSPVSVTLTGSDERSITYQSQPTEIKHLFIPTEVMAPDLPNQSFGWDMKRRRIQGQEIKLPYLQRFALPNNRAMQIEYSDIEDPVVWQAKIDERLNRIRREIENLKPKAKKKKAKYKRRLEALRFQEKNIQKNGIENEGVYEGYLVKKLFAPVGKDATQIVTHTFFYDRPNKNSYVLDAKNNKTAYFWNDDYRITRINRYFGSDELHSSDTFLWDANRLKCKTHFNEKGCPVFVRTYLYDDYGNVREETFYGDLSGQGPPLKIAANGLPEENGVEKYVQKKTYSTDGRNLLSLQENPVTGLCIQYTYRTDCHLPLTKILCDKTQEKIQTTYEYDADLILISETVDDTISRITKTITPYTSGPYMGMPHIITESYGEKTQLKKTVLHYGKGASIEQKDIYDAHDILRYSLKMGYDDKGRLISETNALSQEAIYRYDEVGNRKYAKDFSGRLETFYHYDYSNRLIKKELKGDDGLYQVYLYTYDPKHNLISETDPYGNTTTYVPDAFGNKREIHLPKTRNERGEKIESITLFKYDSAGNQIEKEDPTGNMTKTTHNAYGKPILITHPDGAVESFTYYLDGSLKTHTDANGIPTSYEYDYLGRIVKKTTMDAEELFEYTGQYLTKKTDAEKNETIFEYDLAGRKKSEECCGETVFYTYDELGRLHTTQKGDLLVVTEYDLLDRVIEERSETADKKILRKVRYEYDAGGNRKAIIRFINGKEEKEKFTYDSLNRLIQKIDALGFIEDYDYDPHINRKIHTDALNLQTIETYNPQNQIASIEKRRNQQTLALEQKYYDKNGQRRLQINTIYHPDRSTREVRTLWEYDSRGFLKTLTEAEGSIHAKITHYTYTPKGELETVTKPDGVVLTYRYNDYGYLESLYSSDGTVNHLMKYNLLGHLQKSDDLTRKTDPFGRILKETFPHQLAIENSYDKRGRRKSCKIPAAECLITYEYDPVQLKKVVRRKLDSTPLYTHTYNMYDLSGNVLEERLIHGAGTIAFEIDALARTTSIRAPQFSQEILEFDPVGNITKMRIGSEEVEYSYDELYQITSESGLFAHRYSYDSLNNRLEKDEEGYEINELNQISSHFEYDLNGNPIKGNETIYTYDALDRLIKIEGPNATQTYTYDSLHRRLTQTTSTWFGPKTTYFLYDGQNEIGAFDESLTALELRILGNTPHAEIGSAIAIELQGKIHIPIHDLQGNLACLQPIDSEPTFYRYSAFGEEKTSGSAISPWRFSSKRIDSSELVYFGRRYYIPAFGRWLTPDPAGFTDGMNLYAYVHNGPLTHIDEYGLFALPDGFKQHQLGVLPLTYPPRFCQIPSDFRQAYGSRILPAISPNPKYSTHYYVNGIQNSLKESVLGAQALLKTYEQKANIVPAYSTTFGMKNDLISVRESKRDPNYSTDFIRTFSRELKLNLLSMEIARDPRKTFITCFSRGATDVYHACKDLPPELKKRLIITACGPIMILPRNLGFIVQNLVSEGDWCSLYCNPGLKDHPEKYRKYADLEILPQKDGFTGFNRDHFFQSKTYQEGMQKYSVPSYREYGEFK